MASESHGSFLDATASVFVWSFHKRSFRCNLIIIFWYWFHLYALLFFCIILCLFHAHTFKNLAQFITKIRFQISFHPNMWNLVSTFDTSRWIINFWKIWSKLILYIPKYLDTQYYFNDDNYLKKSETASEEIYRCFRQKIKLKV